MSGPRRPPLTTSRSMSMPFEPFAYLHFAKTRMGGAKYDLSLSGVPFVPPTEFLPPETILAAAASADIDAPRRLWRERMHERYGVAPDQSWPACGTSGAVHLALAAVLSWDDEPRPVAIERPAYGVFRTTATLLGRDVIEVSRPASADHAVDLDAVDAAFQQGAAIVCVTDLHNPTGLALARADLEALDAMAARYSAWVLVDEVYRDFLPGKAATSYRPGGRILATGSFTKCYGLGPLRNGWVFAPPRVIERVEHIEEAVTGVPPASWFHLAAASVPHVQPLLDRGRALAASARPVVEAWIETQPHVRWLPPAGGITGLLRIEGLRDSMRFAEQLRKELDVQVVPGAEFGEEGTIRISYGMPAKELQAALDVLALGIGALR